MNPIQIELATIVTAVRILAAEKPDFVYKPESVIVSTNEDGREARHREYSQQCVYVERDFDSGALHGSCIVGQAAVIAGVPMENMEYSGKLASAMLNTIGVIPDAEWSEQEWLDNVQRWQDRGWPWGVAVEMADKGVTPPIPDHSRMGSPLLQPV